MASPTWTCDITSAEVGEKALFFFTKYQFSANPNPQPIRDAKGFVMLSSDYQTPQGFRQKIQSLPSGVPFLQIAHSGRGKMPLRQIEGIDFVTSWSDVRLPKEINTVAGPEPKYEFIRSAPLEQIIEYVEKILSEPQR